MEVSGDLGNRQVKLLSMFVDCLADLLCHMYTVGPGELLSIKHITFAIILLHTGYLHYGGASGDFSRQSAAIRGIFLDRV
jgi:hypothetical protein